MARKVRRARRRKRGNVGESAIAKNPTYPRRPDPPLTGDSAAWRAWAGEVLAWRAALAAAPVAADPARLREELAIAADEHFLLAVSRRWR